MDPAGPVGDPGPGRARRRAQAGGLGHQLLGLGGELLEVPLEEVGPVGGGQAAAAPDPAGHPLGGVPAPRHRRPDSRVDPPDRIAPTVSIVGHGTSVGTGAPRRRPSPGRPVGRPTQLLWRVCSCAEGLGHPVDERVGHVVLAPVGDDLAQLGLEAVGPDAGPAQVEVAGDLDPPLLGELAVEVEVEPLDGLVTADEAGGRPHRDPIGPAGSLRRFPSLPLVGALPTWPRRSPRRGPVCFHDRPTPSAALFFRDGSGSSPCRWAHR